MSVRSRYSLALMMGGFVLLAAAASAQDGVKAYALPDDRVFPEGVDIDDTTGRFFAASAETGTVYAGHLNEPDMRVFASKGEKASGGFGIRMLPSGEVAVARGAAGAVDVYAANGALARTLRVKDATDVFINDMVVLPSGQMFVTDSFRPVLYTAQADGGTTLEPWLDLSQTDAQYKDGFNFNGIVADADRGVLIAAQTNTGMFWRIDIARKTVRAIAMTEGVGGGDGLDLIGSHLYAVQSGQIAVFELDHDFTTARKIGALSSNAFDGPTAVAIHNNRALVANAQLARRDGSPVLPFTVLSVPIPPDLQGTDTIEKD